MHTTYKAGHTCAPSSTTGGSRLRILVVGDTSLPFVVRDIQELMKHYDVSVVRYSSFKDLSKLSQLVREVDVVLNWFADVPAFLATWMCKILNRDSLVIIGAYEVASEPDIDYGLQNMKSPGAGFRRTLLRWTLKHADIVIAGSEFSRSEAFAVSQRRDIRVIPHGGIDTEAFKFRGSKREIVTTVASVKDLQSYRRKGIDIVLECARICSDLKFRLLGRCTDEWASEIKALVPQNLEFQTNVQPEDLLRAYQESKVYLQPSAHESFCVALAEAMACECVPVVSDRGALPEVVDDTGYIVPYANVALFAKAIRDAIADNEKGPKARQRVANFYSQSSRSAALRQAIEEVRGS
jgi:glycosyltransferase involved in cell wall biosynthesis